MLDHKIAISGAAAGKASDEGDELAYVIGRAVAKKGGVILTGATHGVPYAAAKGAKSARGQVIGFSPAHSILEHTKKYRLPVNNHDTIFFTGYDYAGRDVLLIDLADAVIMISGRMGSLHEFTTAFERHKIIGLLLHSGGISNEIPEILEIAQRGMGRIVMHADPVKLVDMVFHSLRQS